MPQVALTTDIWEGDGRWRLGADEALLELVTGANIACGFHAGDPGIMRETCATAVQNGISIRAQVSYRDLHGFGRRYIAYQRRELTDDLLYQLGALEAFARVAGGRVAFARAHGALYNVAATDAEHAGAIVDAVREYDASLPVLCQPGTEMSRAGRGGRAARAGRGVRRPRLHAFRAAPSPRSEPGALGDPPGGRRRPSIGDGDRGCRRGRRRDAGHDPA